MNPVITASPAIFELPLSSTHFGIPDRLIEDAGNAFQKAQRTFDLDPPAPKPYRSQELQFMKAFSERECTLTKRTAIFLTKGRTLAGAGRIVESCRAFACARQLCASGDRGPVNRIFSLAGLNAAEAFLDYKLGDYEGAIGRLTQALQHYAELGRLTGEKSLPAAQLDVLNSLVRVEAHAHGAQAGLSLARRAIVYLSGQGCAVPHLWDESNVPELAIELRLMCIRRAVAEVAIVTTAIDHSGWSACRSFFEDPAMNEASASWDPEIREWFIARTALHRGNVSEFLRLVTPQLSRGPVACQPILWFTIALDVAKVLTGVSKAAETRAAILDAAIHWRALPRAENSRILRRITA